MNTNVVRKFQSFGRKIAVLQYKTVLKGRILFRRGLEWGGGKTRGWARNVTWGYKYGIIQLYYSALQEENEVPVVFASNCVSVKNCK